MVFTPSLKLEPMDDVAVRILVFEHSLAWLDAEPLALDVLGDTLARLEREDDRRGELRAVGDLAARPQEHVERRRVQGGDAGGFGVQRGLMWDGGRPAQRWGQPVERIRRKAARTARAASGWYCTPKQYG